MTRLVRFSNNAVSNLAANLTNVATSLSVTSGDGAKFPALSAGQYFMATLVKADGSTEVVKVTARSTDTLTIVRAAEPVAGASTAYAFSAGDRIEARLTAGVLSDEIDRLDNGAVVEALNKSANYTLTADDVTKLVRVTTTSGTTTITLPATSALTDDYDVIVAKVTSDANTVVIARTGSTDLINGATSYTIFNQYQSAWLIADRSTNTWTVISSGISAVNTVVDAGTGAGSASITLSGDPGSINNTAFFVGGVYQQKSTYSISGTTLTAGGAIASGVGYDVVWSAPLTVGTPSDATVTPAKMSTGAPTWNTSGNVGVGVTPSAWASPNKAIEVGYAGNGILGWGLNDISVTSGLYYNSTWKYSATNSLGASHYEQYNGSHYWASVAPASHSAGDTATLSTKMVLDASGNLGVGVTPSAWVSSWRALEIGPVAGASIYSPSGGLRLGSNLYRDSGGYKYAYNGPAADLQMENGAYLWRIAPSGTAGNAITFTQAMTLDSSGNLLVGHTSGTSNYKIDSYQAGGDSYIRSRTGTGTAGFVSENPSRKYFAGLYYSVPDTYQIYDMTAGAARMNIASTGQMSTTDGAGNVKLAYDCRAWVNFNGTGTVAIRASGNVSSITDNGTGDYTVNFSTAMSDANYSVGGIGASSSGNSWGFMSLATATVNGTDPTASAFRIKTTSSNGGGLSDVPYANVQVFR